MNVFAEITMAGDCYLFKAGDTVIVFERIQQAGHYTSLHNGGLHFPLLIEFETFRNAFNNLCVSPVVEFVRDELGKVSFILEPENA